MKSFFAKSYMHTVEDIQRFGNNWVPSPYWVRVVRLIVPLASRLEAGQILINTLGEDEIRDVVGGREWWQRTMHKQGGVSAEWISMKKDWEGLPDEDEADDEESVKRRAEAIERMKKEAKQRNKNARNAASSSGADKKAAKDQENAGDDAQESDSDSSSADEERSNAAPSDDDEYTQDMDDMRCVYYIHGGGYFFGSINTHRFSVWRYARKIRGRAFAIDYRKCPQYPFPCALADVLAGYLYLIRPPPGAKHKPVDPAKITIAGDSAGGGVALALLCLIRDSGLPPPAGGVLISPWCDLTHSFPSILENTETDIIPPYGWQFKPSTLWPPPPPEFRQRANESTSLPELKMMHEAKQQSTSQRRSLFSRSSSKTYDSTRGKKGSELADKVTEGGGETPQKAEQPGGQGATAEIGPVFKVKIDGEEVEIHEQIQLYATNEQLVHPYVSPIWQPSLGGLPPLYVLAGDGEVLRDEIIYMAHKAANPEAYPVRKALLEANPKRTAKAKEYPPTKVHLQVYDGICHDLPLLSFTTPAKYCYRAISSFICHVTGGDSETSSPAATRSPSPAPARPLTPLTEEPDSMAPRNEEQSALPPKTTSASSDPPVSRVERRASSLGFKRVKGETDLDKTIYTSTQPGRRPPYVGNMVRERVDQNGVVRHMEPVSDMRILHLDPETIGLVKEEPVKRYLAGRAIQDKRFKKTYERVQRRREHHLKRSVKEEYHRVSKRAKEKAAEKTPGASSTGDSPSASSSGPGSGTSGTSSGAAADPSGSFKRVDSPLPLDDEVQGIWNLHGERPPPSSIAARKDTSESRKLASFLDTHYTRLHALHLWSDMQDAVPAVMNKKAAPEAPSKKQSEESEQG